MIKEIKITNFYSFQETTITLRPDTNILIGINGSGKSNFLKAIKFLKEGVVGVGLKKYISDDLGGFDNFYFKGKNKSHFTKGVAFQYRFDAKFLNKLGYEFQIDKDIFYEIKIHSLSNGINYSIQEEIKNEGGLVYLTSSNGTAKLDPNIHYKASKSDKNPTLINYNDYDSSELAFREINDSERYYELSVLKKVIKDILVYEYFDTSPSSAIRRPILPTSGKRLLEDGSNLTQILNNIKINFKKEFQNITDALNEVNENYNGIDFNILSNNIELTIDEKKLDSAVHVSSISDGTLRYLCLLAILFNPVRGALICIDEPELGLHPDMIINISKAVQVASESSQVIVSTHNENLLNYFEIENIRVFEKDEQNSTQVNSFTRKQFEGWYDKFAVGEMWKQGDIGGIRYGS